MTGTSRTLVALAALSLPLSMSPEAHPIPACPPAFRMEVLVDGRAVPEYRANDARYVEALKGKEYAIRLHNPLPVRVGVALSVDGLNTIDARRTTPQEGRKWILDPGETITIAGWQTSMQQARRFYFTSEENSYATRLGQPGNQGVITTVFFRERTPIQVVPIEADTAKERRDAPSAPAPTRQAAAGGASANAMPKAEAAAPPADEYAATGIGDRTGHQVRLVHLDLESTPAATLTVHYEFRAQLVRLGILPPTIVDDPLARRRHATGFAPGFCPDVK
ncbi:MAG TPA: hypothetical protein VGK32_06310 [Vicinamibacterales bacterium]|jgi:hypothetical protein